MARKKGNPDSVFSEPQFQSSFPRDSESPEAPLDSVWMEPQQTAEGKAWGNHLYADWLDAQQKKHSTGRSWVRTLLFSLFAGPLAVFTAFFTGNPGVGILMMTVAGPLIEEVGKVLLPMIVTEKNPAKFKSAAQLIICATAGGLVFAVIENILYLQVYIQEPSKSLIFWRWTVCVALHSGCSFIAGCGLAKTWRVSVTQKQPPKLETAAPLLICAIVIHGLYNLLAYFMDTVFQ